MRWRAAGLCVAVLAPASPAFAQVAVMLPLPQLPAQQAGKRTPPAIASVPVLGPAPGQQDDGSSRGALSADAEGRYVAMVRGAEVVIRSLDGSPDRILRPPIAAGDLTFLSNAAISPDGAVVAVSWASETEAAVFLFDRNSGAIIRRIDGPADVVSDLRFSPDGSLLATAATSGAIQIFNPATGEELARDADCQARAYSVDINRGNRLVATGCADGQMRVYSLDRSGLRLLGSAALGHFLNVTKAPASVRFSPDGQLLAVGLDRLSGVTVWRAATLTQVGEVSTTKSMSNAYSVVWSADGQKIYAPSVNAKTDFKVQMWASGRSAQPGDAGFNRLSSETDVHVDGHGRPLGFVPLADGRVVVATTNGGFGVSDQSGNINWQTEQTHVRYESYTANLGHPPPLQLSADGKVFLFTLDGKATAAFDLGKLGYVPADTTLAAPITKAAGVNINITGILGISDPGKRATLIGAALPLPAKEIATSFSIAPDGQKFAMGTEDGVRMFTRTGQQLWSRPGGVYAVNMSRDGRFVVADQGVIKWYRASDGALVLSFLASPDRARWVAWTPSGYYEASSGGEDMLEWRVNRGLNLPADAFPLSRFADIMRRPDDAS